MTATEAVFHVLFLDFDGVLNSADWLRRRPSKIEWAAKLGISEEEFTHDRMNWALRSFDPDAVQVLNTIIHKTQARVVMSSTWRTMYPLNRLQMMLRYHGFDHHLLGATPDGSEMRAQGGYGTFVTRGQEISAWLALLPSSLEVRWVVIDDELVPGHEDRLCQTDVEVGLCAADIPRIIETLFKKVEHPR